MMKARQLGHAFGFDNDILTGRKSKEILKEEREALKRKYKTENNQIVANEIDSFRTDEESGSSGNCSGDLSTNSVAPTIQKPYEQDDSNKAENVQIHVRQKT